MNRDRLRRRARVTASLSTVTDGSGTSSSAHDVQRSVSLPAVVSMQTTVLSSLYAGSVVQTRR